ncbi:hypothetical protein [Streptomyces sp. MMS24-I29]|uniref:hypothetical protein n=1 Tax=Streptomyces sp. MMS24-I29 TaxID=3351480 RepID=UPI003C7B0E46
MIRLQRSTDWRAGRYGYVLTGPADVLLAACRQKTPVTLTGDFDGDRLYVGTVIVTYGDNGITDRPLTLLGEEGGIATYTIDTRYLDEAPRFLAQIDRDDAEATTLEARQATADDAYLHDPYD